MSTLHPVAGERFYIGGVLSDKNSDFVASDFTSQTWVEVDGYANAGRSGDTAALITTPLINRGRDIKQKGTKNAGSMQNQFAVITNDPGQLALKAAAQTTDNYAFKLAGSDSASAVSATITMTIAAPGVITWTAHGLSVGDQVVFTTTGALPTGITAGTTYFVKTVASVDTFTVASSSGGSAITTSGTQSGVHTGTTVPLSSSRLFVGLVMNAEDVGGAANTVQMLACTIEINSNIVTVAAIA